VTDEDIAHPVAGPTTLGDSTPARGAARLERQRREARELDRREPLRRRILEALADAPATPAALAESVSAAKESTSRTLQSLLKGGLVQIGEVEGDRRMRLYALTREGEARLSKQRAFGAPGDPPSPPNHEETLRFMRAALGNAVRMRRETNALQDAAARLHLVVEEAHRLELTEVELEAMAELLTTLRQERRIDAMTALLGTLENLALGRHQNRDPTLALPAAAHREYTLGRLPEMHGGADACVRARHLDAAQALFGQLARSSDAEQATSWREREAWSVISLASNLRERSKLEEALEKTSWAMSLFAALDDPYGRSRCLFMFGFCQRLIGDFDHAWLRLSEAYELASAHSFQRFQADALTQMGEVRRCQGEITEARGLLTEAFARSERMNLVVTQAFAQSALGAVAFEEQRFEEAQAALREAERLFDACRHDEGRALNDRRRAVVERQLATAGKRGEFNAARRLALKALERYQQLRSPAGMVACEIEYGRSEMLGGGRADRQVARLIERLDDTRQLNLLELDPWVPKVFARFAEEVGNAALGERAQHLMQASERRLADWSGGGLTGRLAERIGELRQQVVRHPHVGFDMGGEARSEEDAVCQSPVGA
jgi:DNA-binding transcriptional ArsR family regulator